MVGFEPTLKSDYFRIEIDADKDNLKPFFELKSDYFRIEMALALVIIIVLVS